MGLFHTLHHGINRVINGTFYKYGVLVAKYYYVFILASISIFIAMSFGLINYIEEKDPNKIWLPEGSSFNRNKEVMSGLSLSKTSGKKETTNVIVESTGNILEAKNLQKIYKLHSSILKLHPPSNPSFEALCFKERVSHPDNLGPEEICDAVKKSEELCSARSIFEIWSAGDTEGDEAMNKLSNEDVLNALKMNVSLSKVFKRPFLPLIGSKEFKAGKIVKAKALFLTYSLSRNESNVEEVLNLEKAIVDYVLKYKFDENDGLRASVFNFKVGMMSLQSGIKNDVQLIIFGYLIVFVYVVFNLGEFNSLEHKFYLGALGIACVGMGYVSSIGFFQYISVYATPMNQILPFMLLGIGIDDMFVIVEASKHVVKKDGGVCEVVGNSMASAGVAITVTSLTDILAFGIGGFSQLPALRNFCLYSSAGIFFVYFYIMTFFLGFFVIDYKRLSSRRDACLPCLVKDSSWVPCFSRKSFGERMFAQYEIIVKSTVIRLGILALTAIFFGIGVYGTSLIEPKFDPISFFDSESFVHPFMKAADMHFDNEGGTYGQFYVLNPGNSLVRIQKAYTQLKASESVEKDSIRTFHLAFSESIKNTTHFDQPALTKFMYTSKIPFTWAVKYKEMPECGSDSVNVNISAFMMTFNHKKLNKVQDEIKSMKEIYAIGDSDEVSPAFPHAEEYSNLITLDVILSELTRNIIFALICVFLATLFLLADIITSVFVLIAILISIIDITGFMYFWGVSIDTVSAVLLTVSLGLAVDYSAHVGHGFVHSQADSRVGKVVDSLARVGPAVLSGGISTLLAFILLANSESWIFKTFFKIFFLVVLFGIYHGLLFLPVVLSFAGPIYNRVEDSKIAITKDST